MSRSLALCLLAACGSSVPSGPADAESPPDDAVSPDLPDPIPALDDEPSPPCDGTFPADYYQFLDDLCRVKARPTFVDRDLHCPTIDVDATGYRPGTAPIVVEDVLGDLVPPGLDVVVIEIRRIAGVPHYRYLSNGSAEHAVQPWSTTKWIAAANAGARLRRASQGQVGLTAWVDGRPLGDLITSIANYDECGGSHQPEVVGL